MTMIEDHKRISERVRTLRTGRIVWDNAQRSINCQVRDMSKTGAKLELADMTVLPETFDLNMPPSKQLRPVQVMRKSGRVLGVMFLDVAMNGDSEQKQSLTNIHYNPVTGENPVFATLSPTVRANLPW